MDKKLIYSLLCFFLSACVGPSEKYRDIKHLEFPPELAIEHAGNTAAETTDSIPRPNAESNASPEAKKTATTDLSKLILVVGSDEKPVLELKTRFDRAWDMLHRGLSQAEIDVIDYNRDQGVVRVHYVANGEGKNRSSIFSFITDQFKDTEYKLTLDKDKKVTDIHVEKVVTGNQSAEKGTSNNDDSASLVKLLQKTIIADLEK